MGSRATWELIMANGRKLSLPAYDLVKDARGLGWRLEPEGGGRTRMVFDKKSDATGNALAEALGAAGGVVRIRKENGWIKEERTFAPLMDQPQNED